MTDAKLLEAAIAVSGLSDRRFAVYIMGRNERTIRGWKSGGPMYPVVRDWLEAWLAIPDHRRRLIVDSFTEPR